MLHEVYKLRELFPVLAKESIEELTKQRKEYIKNHTDEYREYWDEYKEPTLTAYCPDNSIEVDAERRRPSILICPGGCYMFTSFREGEPIALKFASMGYNAFVLNYECCPVHYPQSLLEVSAAMAFIRSKADHFNADADKIAVCGFSAGGHLAASLGVFWSEPFICETLGIGKEDNRPNAIILGYPVISSGKFAHRESFECLLGRNASPELVAKVSLENQVNEKTPPAFVWSTFEDRTVPVENSLLFANALRAHDIPFELHLFTWGEHGLALGNKVTAANETQVNLHVANWAGLCNEWLEKIFKQ